jgi:hypothetical protein
MEQLLLFLFFIEHMEFVIFFVDLILKLLLIFGNKHIDTSW